MREGTDPTDAVVTGTDFVSTPGQENPGQENPGQENPGQEKPGHGSRSASDVDGSAREHSLRDILSACRFLTADDLRFCSVAEAAATAGQGQLVVYRIGQDCPSQLVADAMARGAAGILTEQVLPCPLPQCIVGDIELALARITAHQWNRPDRALLNVAVVGSAGKTSTTLLIASLLRASGIRTAYQSDLGECDGVVQSTSSQPLPAGSELVCWLGEAVDGQCKASIVEISEEKARHGHYDAIEFDIVVVTGSTTCNGDFGPSGLQCVLDRLTSEGVVIAPVDDSKALRVVRESGARLVTYGVRKAADVSAKIIDQSGGMTTLLVSHRDTTAVMETTLCGPAMAANHAAATLIGLLLGLPLQETAEKLGQLRVIPGRGQRLESSGHATVVLESGGSPERVATALRTHRSMKAGGRLWCIMAIDSATPTAHLAQIGSTMERFADSGIVTATMAGKRHFLAASHHVLDGVQHCAAFRLFADRQRALEWAMAEAGPRDTIVMFMNERDQTAQQRRCDIDQITKSVEATRQSRGQEPRDGSPIHLSIFG